MGRAPCCKKIGLKKGPWSLDEDQILISYITLYGHGNWRALPKKAGLMRCGKSCRLRWINYLRPDIKRGNFTREEEDTIINLHQSLGNRWSAIAARLPGRTDNEIKNVWHTHLKKRINNKLQEEIIKETSSSSIIDIKSKHVTTTEDVLLISTCHRCHVASSSELCSTSSEDMSSIMNIRISDMSQIGSSNVVSSTSDNGLFEIDELFWSEVLSDGSKSSSVVAAEAARLQLSPISGVGFGEKGGFVGCEYDNVMEFWNEGFDRCEDYFALNML